MEEATLLTQKGLGSKDDECFPFKFLSSGKLSTLRPSVSLHKGLHRWDTDVKMDPEVNHGEAKRFHHRMQEVAHVRFA